METLLEQLKEKNVKKLSLDEVNELTQKYAIEKEIETGIAGPIKILNMKKEDETKLILEIDQKGNNYIRILAVKDVDEFTAERLSIYDKMWDGCGCKVFYDEVWTSAKNQEIQI